ncbi:DUF3558 domain-containing protein [Nocardia sp. NBC_01730]|uniref:hypothetical protein n=1 Tax=Nocardia sp. NBC_01730 TaxID=2975998 RepID=UPI002E113202|nr:DUF3558 domain-containing protein [Nocardia sp. NBC_01730]
MPDTDTPAAVTAWPGHQGRKWVRRNGYCYRMRIAALVAIALVLSACSQTKAGKPQGVAGSSSQANTSSTAAPSRESSLQDRISWVQQGTPIDLGGFHSARIENGPTTDLKADIAFVSPTGKISCITGVAYSIEGFDCEVELKTPMPQPGEGYGNWFGGFVSYSGQRLTVGQFRGDPGLFINGKGQTLPYDSTLTFGNYTCRLATTGLTCVNPTERTGVQMSDDGVVPLGCLQEAPASQRESSVGRAYSC